MDLNSTYTKCRSVLCNKCSAQESHRDVIEIQSMVCVCLYWARVSRIKVCEISAVPSCLMIALRCNHLLSVSMLLPSKVGASQTYDSVQRFTMWSLHGSPGGNGWKQRRDSQVVASCETRADVEWVSVKHLPKALLPALDWMVSLQQSSVQ